MFLEKGVTREIEYLFFYPKKYSPEYYITYGKLQAGLEDNEAHTRYLMINLNKDENSCPKFNYDYSDYISVGSAGNTLKQFSATVCIYEDKTVGEKELLYSTSMNFECVGKEMRPIDESFWKSFRPFPFSLIREGETQCML